MGWCSYGFENWRHLSLSRYLYFRAIIKFQLIDGQSDQLTPTYVYITIAFRFPHRHQDELPPIGLARPAYERHILNLIS